MKLGAASSLFMRRGDALLALLVVGTVGMMIVPLPTLLIDFGIALNLLFGVLLLGTALFVRDALSFAAFPTLLLLSTLYRLSLNVSSTRLILLQADAGRVIEAFGSFVVRGDYLVGALVFAVLTLVQFIVIARGAERVAEVSARFSLDAMPGKQMAIDSDLRAGNLSVEGARAQRKRLERESQLYGAMDGAMKFVKGDAVAGVVITLVNVIGGVTLGVLSRGLSFGESLKLYGLLTIGDGLVTQIPALLAATSAGLVVTRVASAERDSSLSRDIARQLFGDARVLALAALLFVVLAALPKMPAVPFAAAALLCLGLIGRAEQRDPSGDDSTAESAFEAPELLSVELSPALATSLLQGQAASPALQRELERAQRELARELGVSLPQPVVRANAALAPRTYRVSWRELPGAALTAPLEQVEGAITGQLLALARLHADDLLSMDALQRMLDTVERAQPTLVRLTIPRMISLPLLAEVLRRLLREGVSVRWLSEILEAIAPHAERESDAAVLTERARRALARRITHQVASDGKLAAYRLSPDVEEAIADAIKRDGAKEWLALSPTLAADIVEAAQDATKNEPQAALLTQSSLRRHVRELLREPLPGLSVLCPEELHGDVEVVPKGTIGP